jgi:hypothetical protein
MADSAPQVDESLDLAGGEMRILRVFLKEGEMPRLFTDRLKSAAGLDPSQFYLALYRLETAGWLAKGVKEEVIPARKGRLFPPRFPTSEETLQPRAWWKLTHDGARLAREALSR